MADKRITGQQLGLKAGLDAADEKTLFRWLLASFLFGKPIQQTVAERACRVIVEQHQWIHLPSPFTAASTNWCDSSGRVAICVMTFLLPTAC